MSTFEEKVSDYLGTLRGKDRENAYHSLIELGADVIPLVAMSFKLEPDPSIRSTLVNIAWRTHSSRALPLLEEALDDGEPGVWREALDGLIALGGQSALDVVRQAQARGKTDKSEWLDEASQQIVEGMSDAKRAGG